eukprot:SM000098S25080  [mRNA]  locus=s98:21151:21604:- [translate_table: standard]
MATLHMQPRSTTTFLNHCPKWAAFHNVAYLIRRHSYDTTLAEVEHDRPHVGHLPAALVHDFPYVCGRTIHVVCQDLQDEADPSIAIHLHRWSVVAKAN